MGTDDPTILLQALPEELQSFEVQAQPGELTARVAELRAAVDWLVSKGMADSRLKAALRRMAVAHG